MSNVKIAVGMIVFESDYVLKQCIDQIYNHVEQIVISEGPVKYWVDQGRTTSADDTNKILDNYPDPQNKITVIHGQYTEKTDESNAYMKYIRNDINYLWQIDADEVYKTEDVLKIKGMLEIEQPTSVGIRSISFYGGFDHYLTGFELNTDNFLRIFRYEPNCYWETHRPPTIHYNNYIEKKHLTSDYICKKYGIQMYHYSYVFPTQVYTKISYYANSLNKNGIIPNYFERVYLPWINDCAHRNEIEKTFNGVHEYLPFRRGPCFTERFELAHPESIATHMSNLKKRFDMEKNQFKTSTFVKK
jgi:hypothetical protein